MLTGPLPPTSDVTSTATYAFPGYEPEAATCSPIAGALAYVVVASPHVVLATRCTVNPEPELELTDSP
jgi:hypothetical protein